jgi:hypothetical protein
VYLANLSSIYLQEHYLIDSSTQSLGERVNSIIDYLELNFRGESLRSANTYLNNCLQSMNPQTKLPSYLSDRNLLPETKDVGAEIDRFTSLRVPVSPKSNMKNLSTIKEARESIELPPKSSEMLFNQIASDPGKNIEDVPNLQIEIQAQKMKEQYFSAISRMIPLGVAPTTKVHREKPHNLQLIPQSREQSQPSATKDPRKPQSIRELLNSGQKPKDQPSGNPYGFPMKEPNPEAPNRDNELNHRERENMINRISAGLSGEKLNPLPSNVPSGPKASGNLAIIDFEDNESEQNQNYYRKQSASITINPHMILTNYAPISPVEKLSLKSRLDERLIRGEYKDRHNLLIPSRDHSRENRIPFQIARLPSPTGQMAGRNDRGSSLSYVHRDSVLNSAVKESLQAISGYIGSEAASPKASIQKDSTVEKIIEAQPLAKLSFSEPLAQALQRGGISLHSKDFGSQRQPIKQSTTVPGTTGTSNTTSGQGSLRNTIVPNLKLASMIAGKQDNYGHKDSANTLEHLISYRKGKQESTREPKRESQRERTASERVRDRKLGVDAQGGLANSTQIQGRRANLVTKQVMEDNVYAEILQDRNHLACIDSKEENELSNGEASEGSNTQIGLSQHLLNYGMKPNSKLAISSLMSSMHPQRRESRDIKPAAWSIPPGVDLHSQLAARGQRGANQISYIGAGSSVHQQIYNKIPREKNYRTAHQTSHFDSGRELPGQRYFDYKETKSIYSDINHVPRSRVTGLGQEFNSTNNTVFGLGSKKTVVTGVYAPPNFSGIAGMVPKSQYDSLLRSGTVHKELFSAPLSKHLNLGSRKTGEVSSKHARNSSNHYDTSRQQHLGQFGVERKRDLGAPAKVGSQFVDEAAYRKQYISSANSVKPGRY